MSQVTYVSAFFFSLRPFTVGSDFALPSDQAAAAANIVVGARLDQLLPDSKAFGDSDTSVIAAARVLDDLHISNGRERVDSGDYDPSE